MPVAAAFAGLGFQLVATDGTARTLRAAGLEVDDVRKVNEPGEGPTVVDLIRRGRCNLVVNTPAAGPSRASRRLPDPRGGARRARPVHHDDRGGRRGGARDRERPRRDGALAAGADRCRDRWRERRSVRRGVEPVGPYTLVRRRARQRSSPASRASSSCSRRPAGVLPRPLSLCLAPRGELGVPVDPIGPGTRALAELEPGDEIARLRPARQRLPARRRRGRCSSAAASASRRCRTSPRRSSARRRCSASGREHHAEAAVLVPNAEVVIDPVLVTDAMPDGPRRPRLRPRADARGGPRARARRRSSPGRRRWPAATAPATAASSRSTAR